MLEDRLESLVDIADSYRFYLLSDAEEVFAIHKEYEGEISDDLESIHLGDFIFKVFDQDYMATYIN